MTTETREELRDRILIMLNDLVAADPEALLLLVEHRIPVNDALVALNSPVVLSDEEKLRLGLTGVINGILGWDHRICGVYEDDGRLVRFEKY